MHFKQSRSAELNSDWTVLDHLPSVSPVFCRKVFLILCLKHLDVCLWCVPGEAGGSDLLFYTLNGEFSHAFLYCIECDTD